MFNKVLEQCGLKTTTDVPPRRRDLMSLRNTYICNRLLERANVYDIAKNCRTSVVMIENHYARWLSPIMSNINMVPPSVVAGAQTPSVEYDDDPTE